MLGPHTGIYIFNNYYVKSTIFFMEKKPCDLLMTLTLEFDLDLSENFTTWCHSIVSYYEQFEVFDFRMTLTFDLQLNLTLTNTQHFVMNM